MYDRPWSQLATRGDSYASQTSTAMEGACLCGQARYRLGQSRALARPSTAGHSITSSARTSTAWGILDSQRLGGLQVDDQFKFGWLFDWQVTGLGALEDLVDVGRRAAIAVVGVHTQAEKMPRLKRTASRVRCRGDAAPGRKSEICWARRKVTRPTSTSAPGNLIRELITDKALSMSLTLRMSTISRLNPSFCAYAVCSVTLASHRRILDMPTGEAPGTIAFNNARRWPRIWRCPQNC